MQYHTHSVGPDAHAFRMAFGAAINLARQSPFHEVIVLVHTVQMLQGGVCEEVFGEKFVAGLVKNKVAGIEGVRVHLETERVRSTATTAVIFAPFVSERLLAKAIADRRSQDIVYIPWAEDERSAYLDRYPDSVRL